MELEKGKLYQVKHWKDGWIIAEYSAKAEAHTARGVRGSDGARSWHEPTTHYWRDIRGNLAFTIRDKGMQVRPVSEESLQEIARLRGEIEIAQQHQRKLVQELREFCS